MRDDLRRFRNGEQVQALVAAAARPAHRPAVTAGVAAGQRRRPPMSAPRRWSTEPYSGVRSRRPTRRSPAHRRRRCRSSPAQTSAQYPPGASPEARYYQDSNSRTGWYALAAFIALIALVAGGVLLYQGLTQEGERVAALDLDNYVNQPLESRHRRARRARPARTA